MHEIGWHRNGHGLFAISSLAPFSGGGILGGIPSECSWFCMRRDSFLGLGGFDKRFQMRGRGIVNHDFRNRALALPGVTPALLLGEGVFHQIHGGIATNVAIGCHRGADLRQDSRAIRGAEYQRPPSPRTS